MLNKNDIYALPFIDEKKDEIANHALHCKFQLLILRR